ncbi:MAG: 4-hydroxyphenylacetate 3-monooxygenase, oxygenase component [SAR202 cluster bacterium]|nr:4-hydroxyphenylacetate 3-monooxygenase, oxygenase component [SAR202 cluster bacterium]|tara:strand:- start:1513 stop:2997 length:1485 start_codon:yes stop_codon:yes gene_type:complete
MFGTQVGRTAMPIRTGAEYVQCLQERHPEVYLRGERIDDVTTYPSLRNGVATMAKLYDMQHDAEFRDDMTYVSPSSGESVGASFIIPKSIGDLEHRHRMMAHWAKASFGMMGRTPDFLNVSLMAMAQAGDYFAQNRPEFKDNIQNYYEYVRENDLVLTHTLVNLQRTRSTTTTPLVDTTGVALAVTKETDDGLIVNGARVLATLGPLSDEIAVYPARSHRLPDGSEGRYSFAFAIPSDTKGLRYLCRESYDLERSNFDHPLGSRFEEMDAIVFFDNVLVPWDRVFLYGDPDLCNNMAMSTNQYLHSGHQVVTRNVAKCEFILGLASLMVRTLGSGGNPQVQSMLAEIIENLQMTKACLRAAEADAKPDRWGVTSPSLQYIGVARSMFIKMYPRMAEILHLLGSSSLMALPTEADMDGPLASDIERYLETDTASAAERVRLFRLAWDTCCSAFGSRQVLYERFFQGDSQRNAIILNNVTDTTPMTEMVQEFLEQG